MKARTSYYKHNGTKHSIEVEKFDTWSLDVTLAPIIMAALIAYREEFIFCPSDFVISEGHSQNRQLCFEFYTQSDEDLEKRALAAWRETIDKMIWSFEQISLYWDEKYYSRSDREMIDWKRSRIELSVEFDKVGYELHSARIQEGLDLFAKYYRCLWS
jgi:hypothetical protein